jgi:hypothetical protein
MVSMNSSYQLQPTHHATLTLSAHEIVNELNRRADRIAPRFSEECGDASCTNLRPGADQPRRQLVWDLHAEALSWNLIADRPEIVVVAKALEAAGTEFYVSMSNDFDNRVAVITGPTPSYREALALVSAHPGQTVIVSF